MDLGEAEHRHDLAQRRVAAARKEYHAARADEIHLMAALRGARRKAGLCPECGVCDDGKKHAGE